MLPLFHCNKQVSGLNLCHIKASTPIRWVLSEDYRGCRPVICVSKLAIGAPSGQVKTFWCPPDSYPHSPKLIQFYFFSPYCLAAAKGFLVTRRLFSIDVKFSVISWIIAYGCCWCTLKAHRLTSLRNYPRLKMERFKLFSCCNKGRCSLDISIIFCMRYFSTIHA